MKISDYITQPRRVEFNRPKVCGANRVKFNPQFSHKHAIEDEQPKTITCDDFIFIWNDSATMAEVVERTGMSYLACRRRAQRYRKTYDMKCFTAKRERERVAR